LDGLKAATISASTKTMTTGPEEGRKVGVHTSYTDPCKIAVSESGREDRPEYLTLRRLMEIGTTSSGPGQPAVVTSAINCRRQMGKCRGASTH
jgi:hypothetical protein